MSPNDEKLILNDLEIKKWEEIWIGFKELRTQKKLLPKWCEMTKWPQSETHHKKDSRVNYSTLVESHSSFSPHPFSSAITQKRREWSNEEWMYEWWPCPGNPSVSFDIILLSIGGHSIIFSSFLHTFGMRWVNHSYHSETANEYRMTDF